jgi:hypothetical protein
MSNIVPLNDIQQMAEVAATSKMFGFKNPQEAMAIMLLCQAENLHPAVAMRDYHVIQGRPALKADAMLARFQQAGGSVKWKDYTDEKVTGEFSHPAGGTLDVTWTLEQAKRIGIANKDNWRNYPRAMLRARVLSEGIRSVYPGCVVGVYTPEEVQDFAPAKNMGVVERVDEIIEAGSKEVDNDGAFHIHLPNGDIHSSYHTSDEWISAYADMVQKITDSPKLTGFQKEEKLQAFSKANEKVTSSFNSFDKIKLKGEIVKAGGTANPKSEQSPSSPSLKPNEEESLNI